MDQIEEKLFLGSFAAARNIKHLKEFNITHIITVNEHRLPKPLFRKSGIQLKHLDISDFPNENLLIHFDDTYEFIENAMCKGSILVHCTLGISRSASVVIAYLMKKYRLSYIEAFDRVKLKRTIIRPNPGFLTQLSLYYDMSYTVDKTLRPYKQFQLSLAAYAMKQTRQLPPSYRFVVSDDPGGNSTGQAQGKSYCCKRCKRVLASELNLIYHQDHINKTECKVLQPPFIEPLTWMKGIYNNLSGTLSCPNCKHSVGMFSWGIRHRCACGRSVVPAFVLTDVVF